VSLNTPPSASRPERASSARRLSMWDETDSGDDRPAVPQRPRAPQAARRRLDILMGTQQALAVERDRADRQLARLNEYLQITDGVSLALDNLSEGMFGRIVQVLEENLTRALQEVLEQAIKLKVVRDFKRGTATIRFHIERDGEAEDIMRGQGGSVANILSIGLRMFALATLPPERHRRFLVLDEQDCWLRPDLVPRLVKMVHDAGRALGFQVLMISHHDIAAFDRFADKIYKFTPDRGGLRVTECRSEAGQPDE
jgi:hypothetical protein